MSRIPRIKYLTDGVGNIWVTCPICGKAEFGIADQKTKTVKCYNCMGKDRDIQISRIGNSIRVDFIVEDSK